MFQRGITKYQEEKLDRLFQQKKLELTPKSEISGETAACAHHFFGKPLSLRWYLPGAVSVILQEHNIFHSSDKRAVDFKAQIITQRGKGWFNEMTVRKFHIVKNLTYEKVLAYLNGQSLDYI
ncbi:MAG: hypothetical protein WC619_01980 [Patescibacteria group bacterium]